MPFAWCARRRFPVLRRASRGCRTVLRTCLLSSFVAFVLLLPGATSSSAVACQDSDSAVGVQGASEAAWAAAIEQIRSVSPEGGNHAAAMQGLESLRAAGAVALLPVLKGMDGASPRAKNWLRGLAAELADQAPLPRDDLEQFFADLSQDPDARYLVFRWLTDADPQHREEVLAERTQDPSLPLRYLANRLALQRAAALGAEATDERIASYRRILNEARNPDQLRQAAEGLKGLGVQVDLASELKMLTRWYAIAPFDNTGGEGFDRPQGPELLLKSPHEPGAEQLEIDFAQPLMGKSGEVRWQVVTTDDAMGSLDLNPTFENAKEAVAYLYCRFHAAQAGQAQARIGSSNANKVWVNGQLVTANEVYHAGSMVDQYQGTCELRSGENWVLLKICQNNQTESWAQDWQVQFRITDATGKGIDLERVVPAGGAP